VHRRDLTAAHLLALAVAASTAACGISSRVTLRDRLDPPADSGRRAYLGRLVREARRLRLAERPEWLHLGHYRGTLGGGLESEPDGDDFFLSPRGRTSPIDELSATLAAFFSEPRGGGPDDHPICRFPARFNWLDSQLHFDRALLPAPPCPTYHAFRATLDAATIKLVFSAYYLNTPASAFGHTFLRIDSRRSEGHENRRDLLDYGIDFSAEVDTGNAVLYAVKGLTGMFDGVFRKLPYYYKVREYNDLESRDLWEYELKLPQEAVDRVVDHLWELGYTSFDYYYLTENCSYHVLGTIAAAVPRAHLMDRLRFPVLPTDTVKALDDAGLIEKVEYRPSLRTVFRTRVAALSRGERALVADLAYAPGTAIPDSMPPARRALVLEAAQDLIDIRHYKEILGNPDSRGARMKLQLLERRAAIDVVSPELAVRTPWEQQPDGGHASRRWGLGGGAAYRGGSGAGFAALHYRLALHDLLDPARGYPDTMAIEFLPTELRIDGASGHLSLERLELVNISSLSPMDRFEKRPSWRFDVGAWRHRDLGCDACLGPGARFSFGSTLASDGGGLAVFALVATEAFWSPDLEGGVRDSTARFALGPEGGVRVRLTPSLVWLTEGGWSWLPDQSPWQTWRAASGLRWGFWRSLAFDLRGAWEPESIEGQAALLHYF
jgi:hypothetical protein